MRIVHTESSCGWGGQEIRVLSEARGMRSRGHDVLLLCPEEARIHGEAGRFEVPVQALPIKNKGLSGVLALRSFFLRESARPIDVVNCHSSTDTWLTALALASLSLRPALVRTRHVSAPVPNNPTSRWLYRRASDRVVTTGESLRQQLISVNGLDPKRVVSVPTGIDLAQFPRVDAGKRSAARAALQIDADSFVVGIVATLRSWKGHRYLIEAIAELKLTRPHQPLQLMIVGDGPQRAALERLSAELALGSQVSMCGNQNDVTTYLHAFDAFALPSYANEGVPQALLQAMACGVPVVTTDAGAIGEIARAGETALVVPKQNASALAAALADLIADPRSADARADCAAQLVSARHSLGAMLDQMEAIFLDARSARTRV
jgi:glycosyltransferase involved in cell wall biosynthesis